MKQHSLRRVLVLQWALFSALLLLGFGLLSAVALWVLEDSFIDTRLLSAELALAEDRALPTGVELMRLADFPAAQQGRLSGLPAGAQREFRLDVDRYLHLRVLGGDGQCPRFVVLNAQDELRVTPALQRAAPWLLGVLLLVLLATWWLAHRFVARIEAGTGGLLQAIDAQASAESVRAAADAQPVSEFRRFGYGLAAALEQRLAAVKREEDTLRFLAHELRTPLQSAVLALAGLDQGGGSEARARLTRALNRLERASAAVLWLGETTPAVEPMPVRPALLALIEELAPLARRRGMAVELEVDAGPAWGLPLAAIEAVLGNLLINALQHGAAGTIRIVGNAAGLSLSNPVAEPDPSPGFGLGIELARRLLARIAWQLEISSASGVVRVQLAPVGDQREALPASG